MVGQFGEIVTAPKLIIGTVVWSEPSTEDQSIFCNTPLEIDGVTEQSLFLRGSGHADRPNEAVMFQLEFGRLGVRARVPLSRVEWRPICRPHRNPKALVATLGLDRLVPSTHIHPYVENWDTEELKMREGNLPVAFSIHEDFNSFKELLDFLGQKFNILNPENISEPNWSRQLI